MTEAMIPLAAVRAMLDAMERHIHPEKMREYARAEALAIGIGYAYPKAAAKEAKP
jgi:hypothetical protein